MNVNFPGLQFYVNKLHNDERFSFIRYGNGEWDCILGTRTCTGSGSQRLDILALRNGLKASILEPKNDRYYRAIQNLPYLSRLELLPQIETWLKQNKAQDIQWYFGDVFHRANGARQLAPLVEQLWKRPVVIVGPKWLGKLPFAKTLIEVIPKDCWQNVGAIEERLWTIPTGTIVSFSAGPTTKVLIHRLFPILGDTCWLIDFGSVWDPYCGVLSRTYHRHMKNVSLATLRS